MIFENIQHAIVEKYIQKKKQENTKIKTILKTLTKINIYTENEGGAQEKRTEISNEKGTCLFQRNQNMRK